MEFRPGNDLPEAVHAQPGATIYGGPVFDHFGHLIAESIHRIWPRWTHPEFATAPVAFHANRAVEVLPPWVWAVFDRVGLTREDIIWIDKPIRFETLIMPEQGRRLSGASPDPSYVDLFPRPTAQRKPARRAAEPAQRVYVSRRRFLHSGSYLGETLVERLLRGAGFTIVYPELRPLAELIEIFRAAETLVFSEGSALHILELCGRLRAGVFVIGRRSDSFMRGHWGVLLDEIAPRYVLFPPIEAVVPLDFDQARKRPMWGNASARTDIKKLLAEISAFSGVTAAATSDIQIRKAEQLDLLKIILDERSTRRSTSKENLADLLQMLRAQAHRIGLSP